MVVVEEEGAGIPRFRYRIPTVSSSLRMGNTVVLTILQLSLVCRSAQFDEAAKNRAANHYGSILGLRWTADAGAKRDRGRHIKI